MKRKINLICPAQFPYKRMKSRTLNSASLMALASLIPEKDFEICVTEEQRGEKVDFQRDVDVVCITMMTAQALRGYEIAKKFKEKGVKVVIGGIHASALSEEAIKYADAVLIGEAENIFMEIIEDVLCDRSKGIYKAKETADMNKIKPFRNKIFKRGNSFNILQIQATRGCPYNCNFCSVTKVFGRKVRYRPVSNVIEEIISNNEKFIFFLDDNIVGNHIYAKNLFKELIPLRKKWIGQASLNIFAKDDELLELAKESGCLGLFIGIESLNAMNLKDTNSYNKNRIDSEDELSFKMKKIHDKGIFIMASVVFGFDYDDISIFERSVNFLNRNKVGFSSLPILTPYPGTDLFQELKRNGRIFDYNWKHYNNETVVFTPARMSPEELKDGADWASYEFYLPKNIINKIPSHLHNLHYYIGASIGWNIECQRYIKGFLRFNLRRYLNKLKNLWW